MDLSLREAQALVETRPDDPAAHLLLSLAYFRENKRLDAQASLIRAVVELDAPPELVQQVCDIVLEEGDPMTALEIWMLTYGNAPLDKGVQAAVGENMYHIITTAPRESINLRWDSEMLASPLGKIMQAQVLISHSILPTRLAPARLALEEVLAEEMLVYEAYLVLGNYHQKAGNPGQARAAWQSASDPAAPDWVRREAQTLLDQG
jgi:tetratricopeptide (TPR) repeat protein